MMRRVALPRLYAHKHQTCALMEGGGKTAFANSMIATFDAVTMAILSALSTAALYNVPALFTRAA